MLHEGKRTKKIYNQLTEECLHTWAWLFQCVTTHGSIPILFLAISSWSRGNAWLSFPIYPRVCGSPWSIPNISFLLFFYFNPPDADDNNNGTLSVSQWRAPNMRQFWEDHSGDFLRTWMDQQSPPRIHTNQTPGHIFLRRSTSTLRLLF